MVLMSVIYCLPMFRMNGLRAFNNQDMMFHLSRAIGLSNVLSSPVNFNNFAHHGTMINPFYPWLFLAPMYIVFKITHSIIVGYKIYFLFVTLMTMLISYFSVYKINKHKISALCFAITYSFSLYRTDDVYYRSSVGEAVAMAFLPLMLLGIYYVIFDDYKKWYWLSFGMSALLYTHLLSTVIATLLLTVTLVCSIAKSNNILKRLVALIFAGLSSFLLSLAFIVPFITYSLENNLSTPPVFKLQGFDFGSMLVDSLNNHIQHTNLGALVILTLCLTGIMFINGNFKATKFEKYTLYYGTVLLLCSSSLFPWHLFNNTPFAQIQFIWRLNAFSTALILMAFSLFTLPKLRIKNSYYVVALLAITCLHLSAVHDMYNDPQKTYNQLEGDRYTNKLAANYFHTDYTPISAAEHADLLSQSINSLNKNVVAQVKIGENNYTIKINNKNEKDYDLSVPVYYYPNQRVVVNHNLSKSSANNTGTTLITIPKGISQISISYQYSLSDKIALFISLISLILLIIYILYRNKFNNTSDFYKKFLS